MRGQDPVNLDRFRTLPSSQASQTDGTPHQPHATLHRYQLVHALPQL
jgi:hypothetical protein